MSDQNLTKPRSMFASILNIILIVAIIAVGVLFYRAETMRREANQKLKVTSQQLEDAKKSTQKSGDQAAKDVLAKVKTHIDIPAEPQPTVATIVDVDALRKTNDFYKKAKNGDNLIIAGDRAILFDNLRNIIIDVVPVQLNKNTASVSPTPSGSPGASVSPSATPAKGSVSPTPTVSISPSPSVSPTPL